MSRRAANKYRAVATVIDGIRFASKREAARYQQLRLLEKAGEIRDLELQPRFPLYAPKRSWAAHELIGCYVADFRYREGRDGTLRTEDVKGGVRTALYRWKKKHVEAQYGIQIIEV